MTTSTAAESPSLDILPPALLGSIMTKLDVSSICAVACTSKNFRICAYQILSFLPNFHFLDIAPPMDLLRPLLPSNPCLLSLKLDCSRLDDSAIDYLLRPSLQDLFLHNCADFSGKLLSEIGTRCKDLRFLYLNSVAEKRGRSIHVSDLEKVLSGCSQLESLILMLDVSMFLHLNFARAWTLASTNLTTLEIGYTSSKMVTELLNPNIVPSQLGNQVRTLPSLPNIQKLCLSVDCITDTMVNMISRNLISLTHLDLRDSPIMEPTFTLDLTNFGLQNLNPHGKLKHLSLVRSQEFVASYFKRVNDLGVLLMADRCSSMESICLVGFCRLTDTGFRSILHSSSNLYKFRIGRGIKLTDLVFHDITATSLLLTHVSLRWCSLLTNHAVVSLASNKNLVVVDLRDCRSLGDEALRAIGTLPRLKTLQLDGADITDIGLTYLKQVLIDSLVSLSVRGCRRLTDKFVSLLFEGTASTSASAPAPLPLQELDLSNLPNFSDAGTLLMVKNRVLLNELRMRQCPLVGDMSVMALASMQAGDGEGCGSCLRVLDLYNCGGITQLSFRWLKRPYFPRLKRLGVTGTINRNMVDALAKNRPYLHVSCRGEELGTDPLNMSTELYMHDFEEVDEFEQWLFDDMDREIDDDDDEEEEEVMDEEYENENDEDEL